MAGATEGGADLTPRPLLVSLRAPEGDDQPLPHALGVAIQCPDFRPLEPAGEAD
jgi:hypothetical protein